MFSGIGAPGCNIPGTSTQRFSSKGFFIQGRDSSHRAGEGDLTSGFWVNGRRPVLGGSPGGSLAARAMRKNYDICKITRKVFIIMKVDALPGVLEGHMQNLRRLRTKVGVRSPRHKKFSTR